ASRSIPGGVSSSLRVLDPPRVFVRAKGSHVWDADGNEYIDYNNAFGPIILGHADPGVEAAVHRTLEQVDLMGVGSTELEVRLAEKIREHVPSVEKILFCNSGSEATYHAIRVSRAVTARRVIVKFQGCYHGWHDYLAANVISVPERVGTIDPTSLGMLPDAMENLVVLRFNDVEQLEETMARRGDEIAAIIVEPIIHTIGCVVPSQAFVDTLRRTTAEHGSMLIFDEVVTGFRHDLGGYQAICGIRPDLSTFAKAMANGYPVAAVGGRADVMDHFNTRPGGDVMYGGTYNGHPLAMSAALATIAALEAGDRAIHRRTYALGERMRSGLEEIVDRLGLTARPTSFGSVFVVYFTDRVVRNFDDALTSDAELYVGFHRGMLERGFLMLPLNLKRNHINGAHTDEDVARTLQAAEDTLTELARRRPRQSASPSASPSAGAPVAGSAAR
ncbi:MAG TPA: aspartate aminotransferase family protein, partial [Candidatus Saccharimonadales bacterium]|nr:aspartate aminotransferase family protein [Candidatus Saccharimonadales bacterium]